MRGTLGFLAGGAALLALAGGAFASESKDELLRALLRQQSQAERSVCGAVARAVEDGTDPLLVVRTAIELGHAPCQVIRCALEAGAELARVVQGAAAAATGVDVISRCAVESGADPGTLAAILADLVLDPYYCYYSFGPMRPPEGALSSLPVVDRRYNEAQASPYTPPPFGR